jgi:transcriptional regulator with XRE-family HTH domain
MTGPPSRTAIHSGDRQLRRACTRFGEEFRLIRLRAGVSQAAVARGIGVARSVICRIELGDEDVSPRIRARAAALLGADLNLAIYPASAPLIHDAAHAQIVERLLTQVHSTWHPALESPVPGPRRRSTDIRLERGRDVVLIEVETRIRSLEQIIRECMEKRAAVAASLPADRRVHVVLAAASTAHHRALVAAHPRIVATAFPAPPLSIRGVLAQPDGTEWPGDGILWIRRAAAS